MKVTPDALFGSVAVATDPESGLPIVAWTEDRGTSDPAGNAMLYVEQWSGSGWESLGGALDQTALVVHPALAVSKAGEIVVAWTKPLADGEPETLIVKVWDEASATWRPLGSPGNINAGWAASFPSVVFDSEDNLVVAWVEYSIDGSRGGKAYVARWSGNAWELFGEFPDDTQFDAVIPTAVAWDPSHRRHILVTGDAYVGDRLVFLHENDVWTALPSTNVGTGGVLPSLAIDANGNIFLAGPTSFSGSVVVWITPGESDWRELPSLTPEFVFPLPMVIDPTSQEVIVAYGDQSLFVKQWNGTEWIERCASPSGLRVLQTAMAMGPAGQPVIAMHDQKQNALGDLFVVSLR